MGSNHKPFGMRRPVISTLWFFMSLTSYLVKIAIESSSQSCERETNVQVLRSLRTKADWAWTESCLDKESCPCKLVGIAVPLADRTVGPLGTEVMLDKWQASEAVTKVPVAPESRMA